MTRSSETRHEPGGHEVRRAHEPAVHGEPVERPVLEHLHEQVDRGHSGDQCRREADRQGCGPAGIGRRADLARLQQSRPQDGGHRHQEGELGHLHGIDPQCRAGGHRRAGARDPGQNRQRLRESDPEGFTRTGRRLRGARCRDVNRPHDESGHDQEERRPHRASEHRLEEVLSADARHRGRDRCEHEQPDVHPGLPLTAQRSGGERRHPRPIHPQHGAQRCHVDHDLERHAGHLEPEQRLRQDQVSAARNGQEFRQSLDDAEQRGLPDTHESRTSA